VSAGAGGRPPPARRGGGIAPNRPTADLDRDPAIDGRDRRSLGGQRKLYHPRRADAVAVRAARAPHPPLRPLRLPVEGGAQAGGLNRRCPQSSGRLQSRTPNRPMEVSMARTTRRSVLQAAALSPLLARPFVRGAH